MSKSASKILITGIGRGTEAMRRSMQLMINSFGIVGLTAEEGINILRKGLKPDLVMCDDMEIVPEPVIFEMLHHEGIDLHQLRKQPKHKPFHNYERFQNNFNRRGKKG